jgi:glycosyltransferase involved in cell wall biosynthesis
MSVQLSLICPVYNVAEFIPDLMQSLLVGVNDEKIEVIFVDDCCPEHSMSICEQFIFDYHKIIKYKVVIIKQPTNQGQAAARNAALKIAKGQYIGFIDSDDAVSSNYWRVLSPYIEDATNDIIEFGFQEFTTIFPLADKSAITELASSNFNPFYTGFFVWTRLYKKELVANLNFPDGMIYEDIFYNVHAFSKAKSSVRLSCHLVYYRKRAGSTTSLRTSQYSQLLNNLITATEQTIENFPQQRILVSLLQERTLILILKGAKIQDRIDRKLYYQLCYLEFLKIDELLQVYGCSFKGKIEFNIARYLCKVLK